ncbi:MAG: hypothetical protein JXR96_08180 [Deltaproteobacteria bacterium]|nr:hypothetical protein [Deltaproteobacteria bacterium]
MARSAAIWLALLCAPACVYDLDIDGKPCGEGHPCPEGYTCVDGTCAGHGGDGGLPDGQDGGDAAPECSEGERRCVQDDLSVVEVCEGGRWQQNPCGEGYYCLEAENNCVLECQSSEDCPDGYYCDPDSHCWPRGDCSPPGMIKCRDLTLDAVIICNEESGHWDVLEDCDTESGFYCDPFDPSCKGPCQSDADCMVYLETPTCDLSEHRCSSMFLCAEGGCAEGESCISPDGMYGACVADATEQALVPGDLPADLSCFPVPALDPPVSPQTCEIIGRAIDFYTTTDSPDPDKEGVVVELFPIEAVLSGTPGAPAYSATVDDTGHYSISDVAANAEYVIKTSGIESSGALADMYTFSIFVRADECSGDSLVVDAYTISESSYQGYAAPLSEVIENPDRGVVLGRISECDTQDPDPPRMRNCTGGLSMPNDKFYYMDGTIPDFGLTSTASRGLFGAANAAPIQGVVAAMANDGAGGLVSLGAHRVRVFPGAASLVLFRRPLKPTVWPPE